MRWTHASNAFQVSAVVVAGGSRQTAFCPSRRPLAPCGCVAYRRLAAASRLCQASSSSSSSSEGAPVSDEEALRRALGAGQGKHFASAPKPRANKYAAASKAQGLDPWEQQVRTSQETGEDAARARAKAARAALRAETRQRGARVFPDAAEIDPYDATTFGYVTVGRVLGPHGLGGEVKVASLSDFAAERLCRPGTRYLRAPARRAPRAIEVIAGRRQAGETYILRLAGVATRDEAARLRDSVICALQEQRPSLDRDEYLVSDLVGLRVVIRTPGGGDGGGGSGGPATLAGGAVIAGVVLADDISEMGGIGSDLLELQWTVSSASAAAALAAAAAEEAAEAASEAEAEVGEEGDKTDDESKGSDIVYDKEEQRRQEGENYPVGLFGDLLAAAGSDSRSGSSNSDGVSGLAGLGRTVVMTCLVPFVPQIVPEVNVAEGYVVVEPPTGLLELAVPRVEKVAIKALLPEFAQSLLERRRQREG